ncbi:putative bifunctional diguanylate cyclase/phosphodiesterase [Rhodoferax lacus]|nr:GGDEF domain-containing phosphodiesterase [Rhodoferax lacus]
MEQLRNLQDILDGTGAGTWDWDVNTGALQVNTRWAEILGLTREAMQPVTFDKWKALVHPDDFPLTEAAIAAHLAKATVRYDCEFRMRHASGHWIWIHSSGQIKAWNPDGSARRMFGTYMDITERKQAQLQLIESERAQRRLYEATPAMLYSINRSGRLLSVSNLFAQTLGYSREEMLGQKPTAFMTPSSAQFAQDTVFPHFLQSGSIRDVPYQLLRRNGEVMDVLVSAELERDAQGAPVRSLSCVTDVSQIKAHQAELDRVANFDALTNLPNRRLLSDRLKQSLLRSDRTGQTTAICFLDLDGFKAINDQFGHSVGDLVLVGVAQHLGTVLRADDTLARLGGDEFVLLLSEIHSTSECTQILERVLETTRLPIQAEDQQISLSASIGVSLYPSDRADPDILLRHADMAMYQAKQAGKNRYQLFDTEMDRAAQSNRAFLDEMEAALQSREFVLFYQPQVDLQSGEVLGAEALIRWQHPTRGLLPPGAFLACLNGSHLEAPLGEWVMETALTQLRNWQALGLHTRVSVNISANHLLRADFCERLAQTLARYPDVAASRLELEVLETAAIGEMRQAVDILHNCMELGVRFALDDFGTGYSSLTYLRQLPVHTLKIDQSFVRDMLVDPDDRGIVRGIIELAKAFDRQIVAEGVETMAHAVALRQLGCHHVQGYGIARPMPAAQFPDWCAEWLRSGAWAQG